MGTGVLVAVSGWVGVGDGSLARRSRPSLRRYGNSVYSRLSAAAMAASWWQVVLYGNISPIRKLSKWIKVLKRCIHRYYMKSD